MIVLSVEVATYALCTVFAPTAKSEAEPNEVSR